MSLDRQKIGEESKKEKISEVNMSIEIPDSLEQAKEILKKVKSELENTKGTLKAKEAELEETKRKIREKEKINKDLSLQLLDLTQKFQAYGEQVDKLEKRVEELRSSSSEEPNKEVAQLNAKLEETKMRLESAFNTIREKNEEISRLESKVDELTRFKEEIPTQTKPIKEPKRQIPVEEKTTQRAPANLKPPPSQSSETQKGELKDRVYCPSCGAFGKDIRVMDDKSNVLYYQGQTRIYGKKRICKKCGKEF